MDEQTLWASPNLPKVPPAAIELLGLVTNLRIEIDRVVRITRSDPRLSELILCAANSSHFGFRSEVKAIERAIPLLGFNVVVSLAVGLSLMDCCKTFRNPKDPGRKIWQRCLLQALACQVVHSELTQSNAPEAFYAGLLLDIGQLAFAQAAPHEMLNPIAEQSLSDIESLEEEAVRFGTTHVEFGAELVRSWRVPEQLANSVAMHHSNSAMLDPSTTDLQRAAYIASVVGELYYRANRTAAFAQVIQLGQRFLKFSPSETRSMLTDISLRFADTAAMFGCTADGIQALTEPPDEDDSQHQPSFSHTAFSDSLTGLYDRTFFQELLRRECLRCQRTGAAIGLLAAHVQDGVRRETLQLIAHAVGNVVRNCDAVSRYGNRTFVAMLHEPTEMGIDRLRQRISLRLASLPDQAFKLDCTWTIIEAPTMESKPHEHLTRWLGQLEESSAIT